MKWSQVISIFSLLLALSCGLALFTLDFVWASRAMAIYFGITHTSAYYLIKELKQNINKLQYRYETEPNY